MLAILLPHPDDKQFASLLFQQCQDFRVYVPQDHPLLSEYEDRLPLVQGGLQQVTEPLCWILEPDSLPDKKFVGRVLRYIDKHPDHDVFHVNLRNGQAFPRRVKADKLFKLTLLRAIPAPLSSFVFRTPQLKAKAVSLPDGSFSPLATVMACAQERPIRTVWLQKLDYTVPALPQDLEEEERRIRARLDLLRWTETFFGDDDYPLGTGDRMDLFAAQVARLYPAHTPDELKELMMTFQVAQGPIRKMRAASAIKNALKQRQKLL